MILRSSGDLLTLRLESWLSPGLAEGRLVKRYNLNYHYVLEDQGRVAGHTVAMTSYPASIHSQDHFYLLSSGLTILSANLAHLQVQSRLGQNILSYFIKTQLKAPKPTSRETCLSLCP